MKHLFPEEWKLVRDLSEEWRGEVLEVIKGLQAIFEQKGDERDFYSVIWERFPFPSGLLTVIDQKMERLPTLLAQFNHIDSTRCPVRWDKVVEESTDIAAYIIFFAAIASMLQRRHIPYKEAPYNVRSSAPTPPIFETGSRDVPSDAGPPDQGLPGGYGSSNNVESSEQWPHTDAGQRPD